jgi:outer membrane protein
MSLSRTLFRTLPLTAAVMLAFSSSAQAQSLVEIYDAARGYDAGFISAKAQFEANLAKANQTLGGILPNIALAASATRTKFELRPDTSPTPTVSKLYGTGVAAVTLSQPVYRPSAWAAYRQGGHLLEQAAAQFEAAEQDLLVRVSQTYFDVLTSEPPRNGHPLLELRRPNFILTPHVAWASNEAMQFLADQLIDNVEAWQKGNPQHLVT